MEGKVNPVTPVANVSANKDTKESNVTNAKPDTIKVVVLANLVCVTTTEENKIPVTPVANARVNRDMEDPNVVPVKVDTGKREMNVSKVWKVFISSRSESS